MVGWNRYCLILGLTFAAVLTGAACRPSIGVTCGDGWCSEDQICAGAQSVHPVCVRGTCGNGHMDLGEECDDGNATGGDGCSPNCAKEICGNNRLDFGEGCDDGNQFDGDGCSSKCTKEECGNEILDRAHGEQCDDGNSIDDDGCTARCTLPLCGNGTMDRYEECDDGNQFDGDGCSSGCTKEICGNRIIDRGAGEQCDDGNTMDGDGCNADCTLPQCGNGVVDPYEQCDDGNVVNGDGCSTNCTKETCGNRILDFREQCDDGNTMDDDGCSASCTLERCGDGTRQPPEQCDDGNTVDGDGCSASCTIERCGNFVVDRGAGEQCDPPSEKNGCSSTCQLEHCGNGVKDPGEECDGGDFGPGGNPSGLICASDCHIQRCGNRRLELDEQCDDGNAVYGDFCENDCTFPRCGNGIVDRVIGEICDPPMPGMCSTDCRSLLQCGNGVTDLGETCDDGNHDDGDGCSRDCKSNETCGNGIVDIAVGEVCDPPVLGMCSSDCRSSLRCGDGQINPGEECDDGVANNSDDKDCRSDCVINRCGDGRSNTHGSHHEDCDGGPLAADTHREAVPTETANCNIDCTAASCGDGEINRTGGEQCDDAFTAGNADNKDCTAACQRNVCGDGHPDTAGDNKEDCDTGVLNGTPGGTCSAACTIQACGNGIIDSGELCDDGNTSDCGTCTNFCQTQVNASAAAGLLLASPGSDYTEGDSFTLSDGLGVDVPHTLTFEFTNSARVPPTGTVKIPFDPADSASTMAAGIVNTVNANAIRITAVRLASDIGLVTLTNLQSWASGNLAITISHLPATFFVSGSATSGSAGTMAGGAAGDCDNGIGCRFDADCKSNFCNPLTNQCEPCTVNAQCVSGHCATIAGFGQCQE